LTYYVLYACRAELLNIITTRLYVHIIYTERLKTNNVLIIRKKRKLSKVRIMCDGETFLRSPTQKIDFPAQPMRQTNSVKTGIIYRLSLHDKVIRHGLGPVPPPYLHDFSGIYQLPDPGLVIMVK